MVTEWIIEAFMRFALGIFYLIPDLNFLSEVSAIERFFDYVTQVLYFFPMDTVYAIFSIILAFYNFKLTVRLFQTIWSVIPLF